MNGEAGLWRPGHLKPMLAQRAIRPFDSPHFLFEFKWDGYRCIAFIGDRLFLQSRNGKDLTRLFPELHRLRDHLAGAEAIIDGELVAFRHGTPDFAALQRRGRLADAAVVTAAARQAPVSLVAFDLLHLNGEDLLGVACEKRRSMLQSLLAGAGGCIIFSESVPGQGLRLFELAVEHELEGIVAKRRDSPYRPGIRSPDWIKIRWERQLACIVGGVTPGWNYGLGALLVGCRPAPGCEDLIYMGKVGLAIDPAAARELVSALQPDSRCPFVDPPTGLGEVVWIKDGPVCRIGYREVTPGGRLRHPVYRGLWPERSPEECIVP